MSANLPQIPENQEIDLSQISRKIGGLFQDFNAFLFRCIQFFIKNGLVIVVLLIVGVGVGFYLDSTKKTYDHQIIVTPNFKSADYLYAKIDLINGKIVEGDTLFLKNTVGLKHPKAIKTIKIEPIIDVYNFIENKTENFELIKLMAEDGDIKKIIEDHVTSKNYTTHEIIITTNELVNEEATIKPLIKFLNENDYFKKVQGEELKNAQIKLNKSDTIIAQIDAVLDGFSNKSQQSDKLVYYNENTQLNDVIKTKEELIKQQGILRVDLIGMDKIIKENSTTLNKRHQSLTSGKLKLFLPVFFVFFFLLSRLFVKFYRNQSIKQEQLE